VNKLDMYVDNQVINMCQANFAISRNVLPKQLILHKT